jgi:hypothetical protein
VLIVDAPLYQPAIGLQSSAVLETDIRDAAAGLARFVREHVAAVAVAAAVALLGYGFELTHFTLSIDEELFPGSASLSQWVAQGRFGVALLKLVSGHVHVVPFFGLFVSLTALVGSAFVWLYAYQGASGHRPESAVTLVFPALYLSCPAFAYYLSFETFDVEVSIGIVLAALATLFFVRGAVQAQGARNLVWSALLVFSATSVYQALLSVWACGTLFALVAGELSRADGTADAPRSRLAGALVRAAVVTVAGVAAYKLVETLLYLWVPKSPYPETFVRWGTMPVDAIARDLHGYLLAFPRGEMFWGAAPQWPTYLLLVGLLLLVLLRPKPGRATSSLLLAALGLSPFALAFVLGGHAPLRSLLAYPLMVAAVWALALREFTWRPARLALLVGTVLIVLVQAQDLNRAFFSEHLRWQADRDVANRIVERIERLDLPREGVVPVAFVGMLARRADRIFVKSETLGASIFEWEGGNPWRIVSFLGSMGHQRLVAPTREQLAAARREAEAMPGWPAAGSVVYRDGVVIVKLSADSRTR